VCVALFYSTVIGESLRFLSSKMMKHQLQNIQKPEKADVQGIKNNTNLKKKTRVIQFNQETPP